jgi:hypothetical protein
LIADIYAGKIHPRIAAGLAPLMNLQLRAIETTDLERRLAKVEKLLAEKDEFNDHDGASGLDVSHLPKPSLKA